MLNKYRQGIKDIVVSFIPQIIGVFTGLIGSILIARGLGPTELGNYALIMSLIGMSAIISDLGIAQTAIRYASFAASKNDFSWQMMILRWALRLRLSLVIIASLFIGLLAPLISGQYWHNENLTFFIYLGLVGTIFIPLTTIPSIYFQSIRRFSTNALINSSQRIITFLGILLIAVLNCWKLTYVILSNTISLILGAFLFLVVIPRAAVISQREFKPEALSIKSFLLCPKSPTGNSMSIESPTNFAVLQMLLTIMLTISSQADIWLMGFFLHKSQIGIYNVAMRFTLPFSIIIAAINTALWPRASASISSYSTIRLINKTFTACLIIFVFGLFYSLFAPKLTYRIFGDAYSSGINIAQLLCLRSCIGLLYCPLSLIGYSFGMIRYYLMISVVNLLLIVTIDITFLPKIGIVAAAIALLISEVVQIIVGGGIIYYKYKNLKVVSS
jgi:O-antigen/teichoic acid export membrane protein